MIDAALFDPCGYSANGLLDVSIQVLQLLWKEFSA